MGKYWKVKSWCCILVLFFFFSGCSRKSDVAYQFELLTADQTNLTFENTLHQTTHLNVMTYMYFFNGGGVAAGDFNQDGKVDLFFTSNLEKCKLFLNQGDFKFKDVTDSTGITIEKGWVTGISTVDINNDGLLDLYVSKVGKFLMIEDRNQLLVCTGLKNGIPQFEDQAAQYGLDLQGFGTQATFFDYDLDGDLDMYQLNHSVHENGTFGERDSFVGKTHPTAGDKLMRNDRGKFVEVTTAAGVQSMVIGYGLGIATGDVNNDGWPDIYIGNDFHENDYLYINQKDGTFKEMLNDEMAHTSRFSMGVDVADFNNDGLADIISLDMQPYDPFVLKSSLGEDEYSAFNFKLKYGYNVQFARNNLQLNNGDNTFSEIGMFAKVDATDWSWAPLFMDFDQDGYKDLFITNGIPARMNDIDYVNFRTGDEDHKWKTQSNHMNDDDLKIIEKIPEMKFPNKLLRNNSRLVFDDVTDQIKGNKDSYSNGAAYADLDNDGDLDIVVNNINDNAFVYRNLTNENKSGNHFISFTFDGPPQNRNAIGAKVMVYKGTSQIVYEHYPVRGFQSSVQMGSNVGIGDTTSVDSVIVIWPDHGYEKLQHIHYDKNNRLTWRANLSRFQFEPASTHSKSAFEDVTDQTKLSYQHIETPFIEFDRERLIPFMTSTEGPALAVGDVNGDGYEDVFFGSSKRKRDALFFQMPNGSFINRTPKTIVMDSVFEDVDAVFSDLDNDGDQDLIVAAGGNEYWGDSQYLKQRYYLNDGGGNFDKVGFFPGALMTASCVLANDFDGDGLVDFFFGARCVPKSYGLIPESVLFKNLGNGQFKDVTDDHAPGLRKLGMITDGAWSDMDHDGDKDLLLAVEWESIKIIVNNKGRFSIASANSDKGLWHFVMPADFDGDGDMDFIAGNTGLNTKFEASSDEPVKLYVNDFDTNDQVEQILTYHLGGREIPFASHAELLKQLPSLKKNYLFAKDFAAASLDDLFGEKLLKESLVFSVNTLENSYFENTGSGFTRHALPDRFQFSSIRAGAVLGKPEKNSGCKVLLAGNFDDNNIEMGRYNADYGNVLSVSAKGKLELDACPSLRIRGQVRQIASFKSGDKVNYVLGRNNDKAIVLRPIH